MSSILTMDVAIHISNPIVFDYETITHVQLRCVRLWERILTYKLLICLGVGSASYKKYKFDVFFQH